MSITKDGNEWDLLLTPRRAEMASIIQPIKDMAAVATVNRRAMVKFL